jgi:hypothetical protein
MPANNTSSCASARNTPIMIRGTSEPSAELSPTVRLLAIDTPSWSTLRPKQMAPNPQAKPKLNAEKVAPDGVVATTSRHPGTAGKTKAAGMITHATTMYTNHVFSHAQRFSIFIGAA